MAKTIDLEKLSMNDLKVLTYDLMASKQETEKNLAIISKEIARRAQEGEKKAEEKLEAPVAEVNKNPDAPDAPEAPKA